jgi:GNAT superfamily N-acetyltransferase
MAVTITYLEMHSPDELRPKSSPDPRLLIGEVKTPQWQLNRFLYSFVGGPWQWHEKLVWSDEQWRSYVESDRLQTFIAWLDGAIAGYYELRRDDQDGVEIAYFGLTPQFVGRGLGGALLTSALEEAWKATSSRVWVHTCTLDHPAALANYEARGMNVYRRETR